MPACSRMKPARIFFTNGAALLGQDEIIRHEDVAELHAIGAGAVHREERLARLQRDRGIGAIGEEHHDARPAHPRARRWCRRNGRDRDWRPRAARRARHSRPRPCGPSASASRCRKSFSSGWKARCRRESARLRSGRRICAAELRIVGIRGVPDQRVLAPRHEGGGAADLAESPPSTEWRSADRLRHSWLDGCPRRRRRRDVAAALPDRPCRRRWRRPGVQGSCARWLRPDRRSTMHESSSSRPRYRQ